MKIRVERTTTEYADLEVEIDATEFAEWTTGEMTNTKVREFLESDREWPENIRKELSSADWHFDYDEIELI